MTVGMPHNPVVAAAADSLRVYVSTEDRGELEAAYRDLHNAMVSDVDGQHLQEAFMLVFGALAGMMAHDPDAVDMWLDTLTD